MESYQTHLAEIQQALEEKAEEKKVPQNHDPKRHREAKKFDKLTLDEKIKLAAFNARMSQARDLDIISTMRKPKNSSMLKEGKL